MKFKGGIKAVILFLFVFVSSIVKASLVEVDLYSPGDSLVTKDLNTGLYWLDLSQTINTSYESVRLKLEPGGEFYGFRYANINEIDQLQESANLFSGLFSTANVTYKQRISDLINQVGITRNEAGRIYSSGITQDPFEPTTSIEDRIYRGLSLTLSASAYQGIIEDNTASPSIGSWLVSETLTPVPIPSAFILFLSASGILFSSKFITERG